MNWESVKEDAYYRGRMLESDARRSSDPQKWEEYADLKTRKGSYTLAIHGYLNAAVQYENRRETNAALSAYESGWSAAMRADNKELAVILTYRMAQLHEQQEDWDAAIGAYERLGAFCEKKGAHFQAADAYEHAAEAMLRAGKSVVHYQKPIALWERNIHHWEAHGHDHDAVWSRKHIDLYKKLFGVEE
ncbi:hypothetical protein [Desulfosarcina ovata]|uniref:Tetratricopeptide repeat protein n=1 Tax=Desulfosarcina ovata subsp. ovata TaxID=2752305 RepID=A0A5K8AF84_9BACT|nr:hypothetical protein [Desulfosarcina ovata]BBO91305.1 hypothetical protein DSCOOX_44850 [Desulfosarcina ovata subsp. ovata]